jgi:hypothetical protein
MNLPTRRKGFDYYSVKDRASKGGGVRAYSLGPRRRPGWTVEPPPADRADRTPLCGPSGPVALLREGRLAKLCEELVQAIKWDRLRRGDLDAQPQDIDAIGALSAGC